MCISSWLEKGRRSMFHVSSRHAVCCSQKRSHHRGLFLRLSPNRTSLQKLSCQDRRTCALLYRAHGGSSSLQGPLPVLARPHTRPCCGRSDGPVPVEISHGNGDYSAPYTTAHQTTARVDLRTKIRQELKTIGRYSTFMPRLLSQSRWT